MKYFLFILFFAVALLNPNTGLAGSCCGHTDITEQTSSCTSEVQNNDHSCPASNGEQDCSGECGCVCCSSIVLLFSASEAEWPVLTPRVVKTIVSDMDYVFEVSLAIWHPPRSTSSSFSKR